MLIRDEKSGYETAIRLLTKIVLKPMSYSEGTKTPDQLREYGKRTQSLVA